MKSSLPRGRLFRVQTAHPSTIVAARTTDSDPSRDGRNRCLSTPRRQTKTLPISRRHAHLILRGLNNGWVPAEIRGIGPHGDLQSGDLVLEDLHLPHIKKRRDHVQFRKTPRTKAEITFPAFMIHHTGGHGEAFYLGRQTNARRPVRTARSRTLYQPPQRHGDARRCIEINRQFWHRIVNTSSTTQFPRHHGLWNRRQLAQRELKNNLIWTP